ncbi:hypothetical protein HYW44_04590 [Candidatus Daviesbacteria bacterium]|nr:hypothetical protein [Candidatus Daviesbacteria bacterium]
MVKMNARQLRNSSLGKSLKKARSEKRVNEIYIILDNVLDTKASINTTEVVEWEYCESASDAVRKCKVQSAKCKIVAIEQSINSAPYDKFDYTLPIALVVGHESEGVPQKTLDLCDAIVEIPMFGVNISLNVMVSLAIVLYKAIEKLPKTD